MFDVVPSGLVRAYDRDGLWKQRFLQFELSSEGVSLRIIRPPSTSFVARLRQGKKDLTNHDAANAKFVDLLQNGKPTYKANFLLTTTPIVAKLRLSDQRDFNVRRVDAFTNVEIKSTSHVIVQVQVEGRLLVEFIGRDDEHLEQWFRRVSGIARIQSVFLGMVKLLANTSVYPTPLDVGGEFLVSVPGTNSSLSHLPGVLRLQRHRTGFAVLLVPKAVTQGPSCFAYVSTTRHWSRRIESPSVHRC